MASKGQERRRAAADIEDQAGDNLQGAKVLIIVENLPVPFDRRVWQEAKSLRQAGAQVSVICPLTAEFPATRETLDGIEIYRHRLPLEARGAAGYLLEYGSALFHQTRLAWKVFRSTGFNVIQGCNPPDLIFLVALQFRLFGVKYIFDHHDICPELFEAKYGRKGLYYHVLRMLEWCSFKCADVSIATNESYRDIALTRGGQAPEDVFIVRSGPDVSKLVPAEPDAALKNGRRHLVAYVGVMGEQEGIDLLLQAAHHLVHTLGRDDIQFHLMGSGPELSRLKQMASSLDLQAHVTFAGRVSDHDFLVGLSTADVCVNPDRVNAMNDKSTMNKILEYMALGKPIVQFDVTEGRRSAGDASVYALKNDPIDFAERIAELLTDGRARARMSRIGQSRIAEGLSWSHQVPILLQAYRRARRS